MSFVRLKWDSGLKERGYLRICRVKTLFKEGELYSNSLKTLNLWPWKQRNSGR